MDKKLLILGMLQSHDMHGYQLNEMFEQYIGIPISMTKSNVYKILSDLEKEKFIAGNDTQQGNRPPKKVYTLTKLGKKEFNRLLKINLSTFPKPEHPSVIGLDLMNTLPIEEVVGLLEKRKKILEDRFKQLDKVDPELRHTHIGIEYLRRYYESELKWTNELISHLQENK